MLSIDKIKRSHAFKEVKAEDDWESLTGLFQMSDNCEQSARNCSQTDILGHHTESREFKVHPPTTPPPPCPHLPRPADSAGRMSLLFHFESLGDILDPNQAVQERRLRQGIPTVCSTGLAAKHRHHQGALGLSLVLSRILRTED